jgi:hypothetical protein
MRRRHRVGAPLASSTGDTGTPACRISHERWTRIVDEGPHTVAGAQLFMTIVRGIETDPALATMHC